MKSLFLVTVWGFLAGLVYWLRPLLSPRERGVLWGVVALSALAVTFAVYPSDPRNWSWAGFVLYLSVPRLEFLAIVGNLLAGSALFALATLGVYWANRKRTAKAGRKARP